MDDSSELWSIVAGIGIIFLWVRAYIALVRIEKNTKETADCVKSQRLKDEERDRIEAYQVRAAGFSKSQGV